MRPEGAAAPRPVRMPRHTLDIDVATAMTITPHRAPGEKKPGEHRRAFVARIPLRAGSRASRGLLRPSKSATYCLLAEPDERRTKLILVPCHPSRVEFRYWPAFRQWCRLSGPAPHGAEPRSLISDACIAARLYPILSQSLVEDGIFVPPITPGSTPVHSPQTRSPVDRPRRLRISLYFIFPSIDIDQGAPPLPAS